MEIIKNHQTVLMKSLARMAGPISEKRIPSIDLLRGVVMILMALDHTRDYFHRDAFLFNPEDLTQTNTPLFFTRWITHFCAPIFVLLAGISARQFEEKKGRKALSIFLMTRGIWLVLVELFLVSLFRTFNPSYSYLNLQVIWVLGISMIVLAGLIHVNKAFIFIAGILLVGAHNLLDKIHFNNPVWLLLHEPGWFEIGRFHIHVHYPIMPWLGLLLLGYLLGSFYTDRYTADTRKSILWSIGLIAIAIFILFRSRNFYGDPVNWSLQENIGFSILSILNVSKYPPSFLYLLLTVGPALIFLSIAERPLNKITTMIAVFGRVPMFYYLAHILLIHLLACIAAIWQGYPLSSMILSGSVQSAPALRGYGLNLAGTYMVWLLLLGLLYPVCRWFDDYKQSNKSRRWWLNYL